MTSPRGPYLSACRTVADLAAKIDADLWSAPGLGTWDIRTLLGHTGRSMVTVLRYAEQPLDTIAATDAEEYYTSIARIASIPHHEIDERARQAGASLGDDPAGAIAQLVEDVRKCLDRHEDDEIITTIVGGMRLGEFLRTRIFELVVHGYDLERATGLPIGFGDEELRESAAMAARIAVSLGRGGDVIAALTGRIPLPAGFSVVV